MNKKNSLIECKTLKIIKNNSKLVQNSKKESKIIL